MLIQNCVNGYFKQDLLSTPKRLFWRAKLKSGILLTNNGSFSFSTIFFQLLCNFPCNGLFFAPFPFSHHFFKNVNTLLEIIFLIFEIQF